MYVLHTGRISDVESILCAEEYNHDTFEMGSIIEGVRGKKP